MDKLHELQLKYANHPDLALFLRVIPDQLTTKQCREAMQIAELEDLWYYLLCCFGCHATANKMGVPHLIRNPEALSMTQAERAELLKELKAAIQVELDCAKAKKASKLLHQQK